MNLTTPEGLAPFTVHAATPFGVVITPGDDASATLSDIPVPPARALAREHHLLLFRGFPRLPEADQLAAFAARWGELMMWSFGAVLDLVEHDDPKDHVFDNSGVSFHWDGMFVEQIPEFQMFHCVRAPGTQQGGRTLFCDTTKVLADADAPTRTSWERQTLTYRVAKESHYGGRAVSPLVVDHPVGAFPTMRYLERVPDDVHYVNRPQVSFDTASADAAAELEESLRTALYHPRHCYAHQWQDGDLVVADNYTLLHAREPYTAGSGRHLRRVHVLGDPPLTNPALR